MSEMKTYEGGCHCGRVRFRVEADLSQVYACNCSICSMVGWRMAFAPAANFALLSGAEDLNDYQFNKMKIHHQFCRNCGIRSFGHGPGKDGDMYSINVRCLDGVGVGADALPCQHFDGRSL
jgi:hypothetical protein